jgi:hypothetical protein
MSDQHYDTPTQIRAKLAQVTHKCWTDDAFRERLAKNPEFAARECGLLVRDGLTIRFHIDSESVKNYSIPMPPPKFDAATEAEVRENLLSLSRLHAEISCSTQWIMKAMATKSES